MLFNYGNSNSYVSFMYQLHTGSTLDLDSSLKVGSRGLQLQSLWKIPAAAVD